MTKKKKAKVYSILGGILIVVIIFLQNTAPVTFRLLFWKFGVSQIVLMVCCLLAGMGAGYALSQALARE